MSMSNRSGPVGRILTNKIPQSKSNNVTSRHIHNSGVYNDDETDAKSGLPNI